MLISQYIKEYTAGNGIYFKDVWGEIKELFVEIFRFNPEGIKEEFGDVFHFLQLYLYSQYKIDGKIWKLTQGSVDKFIGRKKVWQELYEFVGLDKNISGYVGNYKRKHKVIDQLEKFGIKPDKAQSAYRAVVEEKLLK